MTQRTIANALVDVNTEGFLTIPAQWNDAIAAVLANEEGVAELSPRHWDVIRFCRANPTSTGKSPTLRQITAGTGITTKELFALFPKGPAKKVARIAGLGKPEGCV